MEKTDFTKIKALALSYVEYLLSVRRDLHAHPELGLNEFHTAELIECQLDSFKIPHERVGSLESSREICQIQLKRKRFCLGQT